MRNKFAALVTASALLAVGASAFAAPMTVKGQLVDEGCGLQDAAAKKADEPVTQWARNALLAAAR